MQILVGESVDHCSGGGGEGGAGAGGGAGPGHRVLVPCNIAAHYSHPGPASAVSRPTFCKLIFDPLQLSRDANEHVVHLQNLVWQVSWWGGWCWWGAAILRGGSRAGGHSLDPAH